jgi:dCTP deaminase
MALLSDKSIIALCTNTDHPMISPFLEKNISSNGNTRILSAGVSSCGYDVRLAEKFQVFSNLHPKIIDPKRFDVDCLADVEVTVNGDERFIVIPPHSYALGVTIERFIIPRNIGVIALGKSTLARAGIIINVTPIEPGFEGHVVIEISNSTPLPAKVYANEGISQFLFLQMDQECGISYADKKGKYQHQGDGITLPKV